MPRVGLTLKMKETLRSKLGDNALAEAIIDMVDAGVNSNGIDMDYFETIDGNNVTYLTIYEVKGFFEGVMGLVVKHSNALSDEGITHPKDLANFGFADLEAVIRSVKGKAALPGLAQIRLKQACDFFQFILDTGRKMKDQFLTTEALKSHAIQFKGVNDQKDSKDSPSGLLKLSKSTDILA